MKSNIYGDRYTIIKFPNFGKLNSQLLLTTIHSLVNDTSKSKEQKDRERIEREGKEKKEKKDKEKKS